MEKSKGKYYQDTNVMMVEGYDDCIVGYDAEDDRLVYSKDLMVEKLCVLHQFSEIQAIEYLEYNVWYAYVGIHTPIFINTEHGILEDIRDGEI